MELDQLRKDVSLGLKNKIYPMNTFAKPTELKDLVRTVAIKDAIQKKCGELSTDNLESQGAIRNFALFKTTCKIVKSAPYRLDHYAIVLCLSGEAKMTSGHFNFTVRPQSMHFIFPGMINVVEQVSDDFELYMVLFSRDFFADMYLKEAVLESILDQAPDFPPISLLEKEMFNKIKGLFEGMHEEYKQQDKFHLKLIQSMLMQLFYLSGRIFQDEIQTQPIIASRGYQLVQQYKKAVDENFMDQRTVQWYVDKLFVSAGYLGEIVKKETGETAIKIIHRRIYLEASYLLNYSQLSVKEISDQLNFDTPSHFSRFFKQFAGFAPTALKKNIA